MKKLTFILAISFAMFAFGTADAQSTPFFRSTTVDTGSVKVNQGPTELKAVNMVNLSTTVLYVKLYNKFSKAYKTDTPVITYQLQSNAITRASFDGLVGAKFSSGLWIRCTTGSTDTSTAVPSTKPIIEFGY
jgi:hypothetical protein